jgi:hypothetical protein
VRISDAVPPFHSVPNAGGDQPRQAPSSTPHLRVEDIVHLSLGSDGVWQAIPHVLPYPSRLPYAVLHMYSSHGVMQAIEHTRGLILDMYV